MTITSNHNQKLKEIRKLRMRRRWRERSGRFVAEGEDLLAAADAAGWQPIERFCAAGSGLPGVEVEPKLLASASGIASGTRALAVYEERWAPEPAGPLCVYLHGVSDPGNVGTVLRSAEAFGAGCVALGPGSADPYGPKAVRASMGAVFSVPLARVDDINALPGLKVALVAGEGVPLRELWRSGPDVRDQSAKDRGRASETPKETPDAVTLLVGAERSGLPPELTARADHIAHIPIATESLNAAMAATIALYELAHRIQGA
jgi:TrmH family RNA methyltransferase